MCERCKAVRPTTNQPDRLSYKDMSPVPPYAGTQISHEQYLSTAGAVSPWVCVEGFSLGTVSFDLLHVLYLGTGRDHIASMLKYLQLRGYFYVEGETSEQFLKRISLEMRSDCREHGPLALSVDRVYRALFV